MKKIFILLLVLISCQSKEESQNKYSKEIIDSTLSHLENIIKIQSNNDSMLTELKLTKEESIDPNYIKLYYNYNKVKETINYIDKEKVLYKYEKLKSKSSDLALKYSWDFYGEVEHLEIESIKSFYLLFTEKNKLIENREIYIKIPLKKHNHYLKRKNKTHPN